MSVLALTGPLAASSQAGGTATTVTVELSKTLIAAGGTSTTDVTATVTDGTNPVDWDTLNVSIDGGPPIAMTDTGISEGKYTATVNSTNTLGPVIVKATDSTPGTPVDGQTTLTQYGPASSVAVQLSPGTILADGTSISNATATVTDTGGNPVPNETVAFSSSDVGNQTTPIIDHGDGRYTTAVTSSRHAGPATITAADGSPGTAPPGTATLTQIAGPATHMTVTVSPSTMPADGTSATTATATLSDANGNPVSGDPVTFSSSDQNQMVGPTTPGNGTYTARVTASTSPGQETITASDSSAALSAGTVMTQSATGEVTLLASPSPAVTNQPITLFAAVNPKGGSLAGTVTFYATGHAISGCSGKPVSNADPTASCPATFTAASAPGGLSATFTPSGGSNVTGATGTTLLGVGRASTSATVTLPAPTVAPGANVTYTATVAPAWAGAAVPSGTVAFLDRGAAIAACANRPLIASGSGAYATCTTASSAAGTHGITAVYHGDPDFLASNAPAQLFSIRGPQILGALGSTMQWSFFYAPKYSKVLNLRVSSAPAGATIHLACRGGGCPFRDQTTKIVRHTRCRTKGGRRCSTVAAGIVQLASAFGRRHLGVGAQVSIAIVQPRWVGKYYRFTFRSRRGPSVKIGCLAPGATRPGKSC